MLLITDFVSRFSLELSSSSLWWFSVVSVGIAFIANFVIGFLQQRRVAVRSVVGVPRPVGHWLKGHLDYMSFVSYYFKAPLKT